MMADEADRKSPESDKLLLDLAWERQQKKVRVLLQQSKLTNLHIDDSLLTIIFINMRNIEMKCIIRMLCVKSVLVS